MAGIPLEDVTDFVSYNQHRNYRTFEHVVLTLPSTIALHPSTLSWHTSHQTDHRGKWP